MNTWLLIILLILIIGYFLECSVSLLNLRALTPELPEEFRDIYNEEEYAKSQEYTRTKTILGLVSSTFGTSIIVLFLLLGGFNILDLFARSFKSGPIITGLIFSGIIIALAYALSLPFSIYSTFVIEERFGFNRTTLSIYILDTIKAILLVTVLGTPLLALILWFFEIAGNYAWIYCWAAVVSFSIVLQFLAPVIIFPLFNNFSPLKDNLLKEQILTYAKSQQFKIQEIFTMDGSKRSSKLNAFFTGFGRFRKIVFYDTLMEKLSNDEVVAVLAHEMGHFKRRHVIKMLFASILQTGIMFFILSCILNNHQLFDAFKMTHVSVYASLVFFSFLYSPVNTVVSVIFNALSRKHEFEADLYAVTSTGKAEDLIHGLKKLCQANLTNLTPHPIVVFLQYTHPPVLFRIKAIRHINYHK